MGQLDSHWYRPTLTPPPPTWRPPYPRGARLYSAREYPAAQLLRRRRRGLMWIPRHPPSHHRRRPRRRRRRRYCHPRPRYRHPRRCRCCRRRRRRGCWGSFPETNSPAAGAAATAAAGPPRRACALSVAAQEGCAYAASCPRPRRCPQAPPCSAAEDSGGGPRRRWNRPLRRRHRRRVGMPLTPGGCQMGYMCDQNSTYGLHSLPGGVRWVTCTTTLAVIN
jgi:hypothetical protein